jgi:hypothetical protein
MITTTGQKTREEQIEFYLKVAQSHLAPYNISLRLKKWRGEMEQLEPQIHYDITAYKKYRIKRGAVDAMLGQIRDCEAALRTL